MSAPEPANAEPPASEPAAAPSRVTILDPSTSNAPVAPRAAIADGGLARRVRLGLTFAETSDGMTVRDVAPRSAGESAGLKPGDGLLAINSASVASADALENRLTFMHPGEPATLAILRSGEKLDVQIVPLEAAREGDLEATVEYGAFAATRGKLRSVWSFPKGGSERRPAVLVIRGVGASPSDAPGVNTFRELAFRLARAGVITVRYDPQGVGDSQGLPNPTVDFDAEVADARAALEHVRSDERVDPDRVVVIGQGTGGGVAAVLASTDPKLAGLAVVGTIARPLLEYLLDSRRQQMALAGLPPAEINDVIHEHVAVYSSVVAGGRAPTPDANGIIAADGTLMGKRPEYWREYDRVNFPKLFAELKMPVLNAVGEYDFVSTLADHRTVADALKARGQEGQALVIFDGTDHDLRSFDSREAAFAAFGTNDAPVNDRALSTIVDWVTAHTKGATTAR
jgi:pimeloyl-ACP methyl ester carboxylesterase